MFLLRLSVKAWILFGKLLKRFLGFLFSHFVIDRQEVDPGEG
jgi:hypothetical protein